MSAKKFLFSSHKNQIKINGIFYNQEYFSMTADYGGTNSMKGFKGLIDSFLRNF